MQAERYSNSEQNKMTRVRMKVRANADHSTLPSRRECSIENSQELALQLQRQKKSTFNYSGGKYGNDRSKSAVICNNLNLYVKNLFDEGHSFVA